MIKLSAAALCLTLITQTAFALSSEVEEQYPAPWVTEFNFALTKALTQAKVRGCGVIKYRVAKNSDSEFLAACSNDEKSWKAYMVWPNINKVMGPYPLD